MEQIKLLSNVDPDDYDLFSWNGGQFIAKVSDIYDGDTFTATWIWKNEVIKQRCRCVGYNSPEIRPRLNTRSRDDVILAAQRAKDRFTELLTQNEYIIVQCFENDNFGRMLTVVFNITNGDKSLNQIMIEEGHGEVYDGGRNDPKLSDSNIDFDLLASCSV